MHISNATSTSRIETANKRVLEHATKRIDGRTETKKCELTAADTQCNLFAASAACARLSVVWLIRCWVGFGMGREFFFVFAELIGSRVRNGSSITDTQVETVG